MGQRRVLIDALSLTQGGGRTYVVNLLRELGRDPRGFRFSALCVAGRLAPHEAGDVDLLELRLPRAGASLRTLWRVLYEELALPSRARGFDLLYCPADLAPPFGVTPAVVALRNLNIYDRRYYDTLRLRALDRLVRAGLRGAARVLFPSRAAAEQIGSFVPLPAERVRIVPHGISSEPFRDGAAGVESAAPYLFVPVSLERHKNLEVLLRSVPRLADPRLEVWIAGSPDTDPVHAAALRQQAAAAGIRERVRFLGSVPYDEMLAYYRGAAAMVFPSRLETFGHPLLEAMLAGTPIVASGIPVFREIAADAALFFDPDDPQALAGAIDRVRADPEGTSRRVAKGLERARRFSWKRSVDGLCGVFEEVLA